MGVCIYDKAEAAGETSAAQGEKATGVTLQVAPNLVLQNRIIKMFDQEAESNLLGPN